MVANIINYILVFSILRATYTAPALTECYGIFGLLLIDDDLFDEILLQFLIMVLDDLHLTFELILLLVNFIVVLFKLNVLMLDGFFQAEDLLALSVWARVNLFQLLAQLSYLLVRQVQQIY